MTIADDRVDEKKKKYCLECRSNNLDFGKFDPQNGSVVKCLECGNVIVINHMDFNDRSMGELGFS